MRTPGPKNGEGPLKSGPSTPKTSDRRSTQQHTYFRGSLQTGPETQRDLDGSTSIAALFEMRLQSMGHRDIPPTARDILNFLLEHVDAEGKCSLMVREISLGIGMSHRTVQRYVSGLGRKGWLWRRFIPIGHHSNAPNEYQLLLTGRPWTREEREHDPRKPKAFPRPYVHNRVTLFSPDSIAFGGASPSGEDPREGAEERSSEVGEDRDEVETILDAIGSPDSSPPIATPSPPVRESFLGKDPQKIREKLQDQGFADLTGDGFELRLLKLCHHRKLSLDTFLSMISVMGNKREVGLFNAKGGWCKWMGPPEQVRGFLYVCLAREKSPRPISDPKPRPWRDPHRFSPEVRERILEAIDRRREARADVDAAPQGAHGERVHPVKPIEEKNLDANGREILATMKASYHGEAVLLPIANPAIAHWVSQWTEGANCGRIPLRDMLVTIQWFATSQAFQLKRSGMPLETGMLERFFRGAVRNAKIGAHRELGEKVKNAKFFEPRKKVNTVQPGDLSHINNFVGKPLPAIDEERLKKSVAEGKKKIDDYMERRMREIAEKRRNQQS